MSRRRLADDSNRQSISLKETEAEDEDFDEEVDDQFEAFGSIGRQNNGKNAWQEGGARRGEIQRKLMKCFSLLVTEKGMGKKRKNNRRRRNGDDDNEEDEENDEEDEDVDDDYDDDNEYSEEEDEDAEDGVVPIYDHSGRRINKEYRKGIKAPDYINQLRGILFKDENLETKDFCIFLAKGNFVKSKLRQLMELCAPMDSSVGLTKQQEDKELENRELSLRCCQLCLVLLKKMRPTAWKSLTQEIKFPGKKGKESKEEGTLRYNRDMKIKKNAQEQLSALLSFKEALCSELIALSVMGVFKHNWMMMNRLALSTDRSTEMDDAKKETSKNIAVCFSYLRRILAIDSVPQASSQAEQLRTRGVHCRLVLHFKPMLLFLPAIISDIQDRKHDDWLVDIMLILAFILRGHNARDLFRIYKEGGIIPISGVDDRLMDNVGTTADEKATRPTPSHDLSSSSSSSSSATSASHNAGRNPPLSQKTVVKDVVVPKALVHRMASKATATGTLSSMLKSEREKRLQLDNGSKTHNRAGGAFRIPNKKSIIVSRVETNTATTSASTTNISAIKKESGDSTAAPAKAPAATQKDKVSVPDEDDEDKPKKTDHIFDKRIVSNPFDLKVPQVQPKQVKKTLTFAVDPESTKTLESYSSERDGLKACVVVATVIDRICSSGGLNRLILRVHEDTRRDENKVGPEQFKIYFQVLATALHYNRLKLMSEKAAFEETRRRADEGRPNRQPSLMPSLAAVEAINGSGAAMAMMASSSYQEDNGNNGEEGPKGWEPDLRNMINALDKMSRGRVLASMQIYSSSLNAKERSPKDVHLPMEVYKEMICYAGLMLESANEGHHEIAVAMLDGFFYSRSDRTDPLPRLLHEWKPGVYSRKHLNCLVELVHETLKTLELARVRFGSNGAPPDKKKGSKKNRKEGDINVYIANCVAFSVDDYFKRIVGNHTVRIYTRLLSKCETNEPHINHYAYRFLHRLCAFKLEQDYKAPPPPPIASPAPGPSTPSLLVEEVTLGHLLFNIQTLMVFSDILNNPRITNQKAMEPLVRLIKAVVRRFGDAVRKNQMLFVEALFMHPKAQEHCVQLDSVYEAPAYVPGATSNRDIKHFQGESDDSDRERAPTPPRRRKEDIDHGDEFDENDLPESFKMTKKSRKTSRTKAAGGDGDGGRDKPPRKRRSKAAEAWTEEEDAVLRREYPIYAGTSSVFDNLAVKLEEEVGMGRNRNVKSIELRVQQLRLHEGALERSDDSDSDNNNSDRDSDSDSNSKRKSASGKSKKSSKISKGKGSKSAVSDDEEEEGTWDADTSRVEADKEDDDESQSDDNEEEVGTAKQLDDGEVDDNDNDNNNNDSASASPSSSSSNAKKKSVRTPASAATSKSDKIPWSESPGTDGEGTGSNEKAAKHFTSRIWDDDVDDVDGDDGGVNKSDLLGAKRLLSGRDRDRDRGTKKKLLKGNSKQRANATMGSKSVVNAVAKRDKNSDSDDEENLFNDSDGEAVSKPLAVGARGRYSRMAVGSDDDE